MQIHRVTVSVPKELRRRMELAGRLLNWSAVATAAFEAALQQLEQRREPQALLAFCRSRRRPA